MVDYFSIFGLPRTASDSEIKEAYRRLAKLYHPDSNNADPEALVQMKRINEAKAVLMDPVKRETHRVELGLRERLTEERLNQLRREAIHFVASRPQAPIGPPSFWAKHRNKIVFAGLCSFALLVVGIVTAMSYRDVHEPTDPIRAIIERHERGDVLPFDKPERDTVVIKDDSLDRLRRKADILFAFGEYKSASKYWEKCLEKDPGNDTVIRNLSLAYFKRGKYAQSLNVLSKQMHGDSNLVVAYYNIGELFLKEEKPFDARNAFEETVKVGERLRTQGKDYTQFVQLAKAELVRLN